MSSFKFKRGDWAEDVITGLVGIVVARQDHITRCVSYLIQPRKDDSDGTKIDDCFWVDEVSLKPHNKPRVKLDEIKYGDTPPG